MKRGLVDGILGAVLGWTACHYVVSLIFVPIYVFVFNIFVNFNWGGSIRLTQINIEVTVDRLNY